MCALLCCALLHVQTEKASNIDVVCQEVVVVVAGNFYNKYGNERDLFDIWPGQAVLQSQSSDLMMILSSSLTVISVVWPSTAIYL